MTGRARRSGRVRNHATHMELCGWGRYLASMYTFGAPVPGVYMPDLDGAGCILHWGCNPSVSRLAHATSTVAALRRGAKLVVVDPRRAGFASRADHWLRVRPGTDAALALAMTHVLLERGWFDEAFVRRWTNAPLLVREDTGRLLRVDEVWPDTPDAIDGADGFVAWDEADGLPVPHAGGTGGVDVGRLALHGEVAVPTPSREVACRPACDRLTPAARRMRPSVAEDVTGVPAGEVEAAARQLWESRPVAFYIWSGLEQHSTTTQSVRAIHLRYALLGSFDVPGGNVAFTPVPTNPVEGLGLLPTGQAAKAVGRAERPLGPARFEFVNGEDVCTAILEGRPYPVRGMVNFGANLTMAHGDSTRVRDALSRLDLLVHADLFMNPTAELADVVLPVATAFEPEALRVGFEMSQEAVSHVQLRRALVPPRGEARSDLEIVFQLAVRLGLGELFFDGDVEAGWRHQLAPSGVTLQQLREEPGGIRVPAETRHRKYASSDGTATSPAAQPPARPRGGAAPGHRGHPRRRRGRLGPDRDTQRVGACPSRVQREPRPGRRGRPARLVAGLRRARRARPRAVRTRQHQPQPGPGPRPRATRSAAARPCGHRSARWCALDAPRPARPTDIVPICRNGLPEAPG